MIAQALRIARIVLNMAPAAIDLFEDIARQIAGAPKNQQAQLAREVAAEIRRRRAHADAAVNYIRTGKGPKA